ncbi:outer dense fiber protein 3B-like [Sipha flava]|uniref:Outer dense fiber protein 3B-like n=1 Tax=Sipha flava TaxID=143950 RepID=A0A2S2QJE4_9HEMI|nr:outer dense fiber protein 3B-like [Sipha flava]
MKKYCSTKMDPKAFEFGRDATGPGPAAYGIKTTVGWQNRMPNIAKGPAYTFKQVLKVDDATESPGPKYNLERLTCHGKQAVPKFYMGLNLPEIPDEASPGPAAYMVQNMRSRAKPKILLPLPRLDSVSRCEPRFHRFSVYIYRIDNENYKRVVTKWLNTSCKRIILCSGCTSQHCVFSM